MATQRPDLTTTRTSLWHQIGHTAAQTGSRGNGTTAGHQAHGGRAGKDRDMVTVWRCPLDPVARNGRKPGGTDEATRRMDGRCAVGRGIGSARPAGGRDRRHGDRCAGAGGAGGDGHPLGSGPYRPADCGDPGGRLVPLPGPRARCLRPEVRDPWVPDPWCEKASSSKAAGQSGSMRRSNWRRWRRRLPYRGRHRWST